MQATKTAEHVISNDDGPAGALRRTVGFVEERFTASARRLYHRMVGRRGDGEPESPGALAEADGLAAVALVEASASDAAGLGASYPAAAAARRFEHQARLAEPNLFHHRLAALRGARGRGGLAAALGLSASGLRATAFLSGPNLTAALDLLGESARRHLPLVVHLAARAGQGAGDALGSGHEAYHAASSSGVFQLFAANVQEAADFALIARRVAEDGLATGLVAMDVAETALAVQDLVLPSPELVRRFVGDASEEIPPPTPSQEMLFGRSRRRVPRWHDPEHPTLQGAAFGPEAFALAEVSRRAYFDAHLPALLESAFESFGRETGRHHAAFSSHRVDGAKLVLVAQGAAVETVEAVAEHLRGDGLAVGVLGVRVLRPLNAARLVELLGRRQAVLVLERVDAPVQSEGPLVAEIRSVLERSNENHRFGAASHPGLPALGGREMPRLASVLYGLGGFPLRATDLVALCREYLHEPEGWRSRVYLGLEMAAESSYPKREALRDALSKSYPDLARLGLRGSSVVPELRPKGAFTVAFHRPAGVALGLAGEAASLVRHLLGGHLRSRLDVFTHAGVPLRDPGDEVGEEVAVWLQGDAPPARPLVTRLREGSAVLLAGKPKTASDFLRRTLRDRGVTLYTIEEAASGSLARDERLLGALLGVLDVEEKASVELRKLLAARREMLVGVADQEREARLDALKAGFENVRRLDPEAVSSPLDPPRGTVASEAAAEPSAEVPAAVRRTGRSDAPMGDLPGFWDRVGVLYREGAAAELVPDPFLAAGTVPALATALREASPRSVFPAFDPVPCTGCGDCWTVCPSGAVGPAVVSPKALLDFAMDRARRRGGSVAKLRMVSSKLAARVLEEARGDWQGGAAGALFDAAFDAVRSSTKLPEGVAEAFRAVREELAEIPLARTAAFLDAADGDGELLAVAVDPDVCNGCGLCVEACVPEALTEAPDQTRRSAAARRLWEVQEELPEPVAATLERARGHGEVGPLAGALLSRAARSVMVSDDGGEPGSGISLALRQVLGSATFHLQPVRAAQLAEMEEQRGRLAKGLHETLARSLPDGDLDALGAGLEAFEQPDVDLVDLVGRVETAFETERVDVAATRRLVEAARALDAQTRRMGVGEAGGGSALLSVVASLDAASSTESPEGWIGTFPDNPFAVPVTVDSTGDAAELARGLVEGDLRETVATARVLRRARLEADAAESGRRSGGRRSGEAAHAADAVERLIWEELSAEERRLCPPLFLVTTDGALEGADLGALLRLLGTDLPVKLVVLSDGSSEGSAPALFDLRRLSAAFPDVFMVQTSIAHGDHLEGGVAAAVEAGGPAVVRVLAPRPERRLNGHAVTLERARQAVESKSYVLFRCDGAAVAAEAAEDPVKALEERHAAELAALRGEYEARLVQARSSFQAEMAQQIQGRLLMLVREARRAPQ